MTKYSFDEEGVTFYFFVLTLVGFYVIPTTFRLVWPKHVSEHDKEPLSSSAESKEKMARLQAAEAKKKTARLPHMLLLAVMWLVFGWALYSAWMAKLTHKAYDPFELLGVPSSATETDVKKAFKRLSRLYHPDKAAPENRDTAEEKFVEMSKAYKALTDPKIRKNWEEFGNPDGIRTFALGVALPNWLVNANNRMLVLALYCLVFGVGLPLLVRQWWSKSKVFTKDGIRQASMATFFRDLKENSSRRKIVEILSNASEFEDEFREQSGKKDAALKDLLKTLCEHPDPFGSDNFELPKKVAKPAATKAHALLYAHFHRIPIADPGLKDDQSFVVSKCAHLLQGVLQIALARQWLHPTNNCMILSQYVVQAMWDNQLAVLELPYITNYIAKQLGNSKHAIKSIPSLLKVNEADRRLLLKALSDEEYQELVSIGLKFPEIRVDAISFKILGQEHITPSGFITCQVKLSLDFPKISPATTAQESSQEHEKTPPSLEEEVQTFEFDEDGNLVDDPGRKVETGVSLSRPIYCPRFSALKRPCWWVSLVNKSNTNFVAAPVKVADLVDSKTVVLQFPAPPKPMNVSLLLVVRGDSVVGTDLTKEVKFTVVPQRDPTPNDQWDISGDEEDQKVPFADEI